MLALWIVLALVVVVSVVALSIVGSRRSAARRHIDGGAHPGPQTSRPEPPVSAVVSAPPDVPTDVPTDAPSDARPDAPADARPDAPADARPDAPADAPDIVGVEPPERTVPQADLREQMGKTRGLLSGYLRALRGRGSVDEQTWVELEEALLRADVGVATTSSLLADLRSRVGSGDIRGPDAVVAALRSGLRASFAGAGSTDLMRQPGVTNVWLFVGVNGVGKTTTIGKVARREAAAGHSPLLAAGDTFRAAAAEQLAGWAARADVGLVRGAEGSDPSAVVFDAVQRAAARGNDVVLADTAGRLHTKVNLVEELKKIRRVADRPPGCVTEVLLVLDATTGQNGLVQARQFLEAVGVTGVVLTKLDGTAKGGIVVAIQREIGLPVKLVGIGEGPDDLITFDADRFVDALFD
jgi:fused signal recognition particle receptor